MDVTRAYERVLFGRKLERATLEAETLLGMANAYGYRADCLREGARALRGALRNVEHEDATRLEVPPLPTPFNEPTDYRESVAELPESRL